MNFFYKVVKNDQMGRIEVYTTRTRKSKRYKSLDSYTSNKLLQDFAKKKKNPEL